MGAPNAFGTAVNNMGMQQSGASQVASNVMNSMAPMGGAPQTTMSMGGSFGQASMQQPMGQQQMSMQQPMQMGGGLMAPMSSQPQPSSPSSNAANAM